MFPSWRSCPGGAWPPCRARAARRRAARRRSAAAVSAASCLLVYDRRSASAASARGRVLHRGTQLVAVLAIVQFEALQILQDTVLVRPRLPPELDRKLHMLWLELRQQDDGPMAHRQQLFDEGADSREAAFVHTLGV